MFLKGFYYLAIKESKSNKINHKIVIFGHLFFIEIVILKNNYIIKYKKTLKYILVCYN